MTGTASSNSGNGEFLARSGRFEVEITEVSRRSGSNLTPEAGLFIGFAVVAIIVGVASGINSVLHDLGRSINPAHEVRGGAFITAHLVILGVALVLVSNVFGRILGVIGILISLAWVFGTPLRPEAVGPNAIVSILGLALIIFGFPTRRFLRTIGALLIFLQPGLSIMEQARNGSANAAFAAPADAAAPNSPGEFGEAQEQERVDKAEAAVRSTYANGGLSALRSNLDACYGRAAELNDLSSSIYCFAFHYMTGALEARDAGGRFDPAGVQVRANNHLKRFIDNADERKSVIARWAVMAKLAAARLVQEAAVPVATIPAADVQPSPTPYGGVPSTLSNERQVAEGDSDDDGAALPPLNRIKTFDPSFECVGNHNPTEQEICQNADLTRMDLRADLLFANALTAARGRNLLDFSSTLAEWQRRRDACIKDIDCIAAAYATRISELERPSP